MYPSMMDTWTEIRLIICLRKPPTYYMQTWTFQGWLSQLLWHPIIEGYMEAANIALPKNIIPKKFHVITHWRKNEINYHLVHQILTQHQSNVMLGSNWSCFAKTSQLFNANHWDTSALAQKIGCRFPFAKVLDAVENSKDTVLMTRSMHCDALFGTDWSSKLDRHDIHLRIAELCQAKSKCLKNMKCVMQNSFCWCQSKKLLKTSKKFTQNFEKSTLIHEFPSFLFS